MQVFTILIAETKLIESIDIGLLLRNTRELQILKKQQYVTCIEGF
jgi:hypothetical protein